MPTEANVFNLDGHNLQVTYSTGALGSIKGLIYHAAHQNQTLKFSDKDIRQVSSDLGDLVSVTIHLTVDTGSTTFAGDPRVRFIQPASANSYCRNYRIASAVDRSRVEPRSVGFLQCC